MTTRRSVLALAVAAVLGLGASPKDRARAEEAPLRVGLLPFTNTLKLMRLYAPLKDHLEAALGRPVVMGTDPDYLAHYRAVHDGAYDLMITGPHFGADGIAAGKFLPLFRYDAELRPILVVRKESGITSPEGLRGRAVALSSRLSVSSIGGLRWLTESGLHADEDVAIVTSPTHTTAMMAVALGDVDGALTTYTPLQQLAPDIRERLAVLESPLSSPHLFTMVAAGEPAASRAAIRAALLSFQETERGRAFFRDSGYTGFVPLGAEDVAAMDGIIAELKRQIARMSP